MLILIQYLLCARHLSKYLTYINIFNSHNNPVCYVHYLLLVFTPPCSHSLCHVDFAVPHIKGLECISLHFDFEFGHVTHLGQENKAEIMAPIPNLCLNRPHVLPSALCMTWPSP